VLWCPTERQGCAMNLKILQETPPWDWPKGTGKRLADILRDRAVNGDERLLAAELAGDFTVIDDPLVGTLLSILRSGQAAISLGPALEYADTGGFDDPDEVPISERTFREIRESLRTLFRDAGVPKDVRRRILEASVRAPEDWHRDAIRAAYASEDEDWKLTAIFGMRYVSGFEREIVAALESESPDVHYEAVCAAGVWSVEAAWPHVAALVTAENVDKPLRLAAIDAVASIRPDDAVEILGELLDSTDEDIVEAVHEALAMAEGVPDEDEEDDAHER
jgi:hypothetical protein